MRASTLLPSALIGSLLALACAERPEATRAAKRAAEPAAEPEVVAAGERAPAEPQPTPAPEAPAPVEADEPDAPAIDEPAAVEVPVEPEPPAEPEDPLAPILPSNPEPGSPEADAELAELLEESTLTQAEFDAAFRGSKPKLHGDQFVFGPGQRTRKAPVVKLGTPKFLHAVGTAEGTGSTLAQSEITKLAKAHLRGFEGCLAVALTDDPKLEGSATLRARFDAKGEVDGATVHAEKGAVGTPLRECLAAVANDWSLPAAAGADVELPLTLRAE